MIKQTLYFGNPAYLSLKDRQLVIRLPDKDQSITRPIEDIGVVIVDNKQITAKQLSENMWLAYYLYDDAQIHLKAQELNNKLELKK